jgi:hypothetical protein
MIDSESMIASFSTIYQRGRFASRAMPEKERMQQRERFGTACLAQCLRNEADFRNNFLARVCQISATDRDWEINVDKFHWADVLLTSGNSAVIVECKVGDALEPEQNPWAESDAFMQAPKGYGICISSECKHQEVNFVTLTASIHGSRVLKGKIACLSATWSQVLDYCSTTSSWINDLFLSLANLDYASFQIMKIRNEQTRDVKAALACSEILTTFAHSIGVVPSKVEHEAQGNGKVTNGYIGIEIKRLRDDKDDKSFRELIRPTPGYNIAWFGYEFGETASEQDGATLSVWFYCAKDGAEQAIISRCEGASPWAVVEPKKERPTGEKNFLQYRAPVNTSEPDIVLFERLFKCMSLVGRRSERGQSQVLTQGIAKPKKLKS